MTGQTVWQLCQNENGEYDLDTYEALLHFWTPQTHKFHPTYVKQAILTYFYLFVIIYFSLSGSHFLLIVS